MRQRRGKESEQEGKNHKTIARAGKKRITSMRERERERNHYNNKPSRAIITQYIICLRRKVCSELERRG